MKLVFNLLQAGGGAGGALQRVLAGAGSSKMGRLSTQRLKIHTLATGLGSNHSEARLRTIVVTFTALGLAVGFAGFISIVAPTSFSLLTLSAVIAQLASSTSLFPCWNSVHQ